MLEKKKMKNKSLISGKRGSGKLPLNIIIFGNTPAGHTCGIGAKDCKTCCIKNKEGKRQIKTFKDTEFLCYASLSELQYEAVYSARWANYRLTMKAIKENRLEELIIDSVKCLRSKRSEYIRYHESGDIINKSHLIGINNAAEYLYKEYGLISYLYTKSLPLFDGFKVNKGLRVTCSLGGTHDQEYSSLFEKKCRVIYLPNESKGQPIDHNDYHAYSEFKGTFCHLVHGSIQTPKARQAIQQRKKEGLFTGYKQGYQSKTKQLQEA